MILVPGRGLEPLSLSTLDPKSSAFPNFAIPALSSYNFSDIIVAESLISL